MFMMDLFLLKVNAPWYFSNMEVAEVMEIKAIQKMAKTFIFDEFVFCKFL